MCVCLSGWSHKRLSLQPKQILCLTHCLNIAKCARCLVLKSSKSVSLCWIQIGLDSPEPGCYTVKRQTLCRTAAVSPSKYLSWNLRDEITSLYLDYDGSDVKFLQIFNWLSKEIKSVECENGSPAKAATITRSVSVQYNSQLPPVFHFPQPPQGQMANTSGGGS